MESGSRNSYGGQTSTSRMDRLTMDQFVAIPQHSTLSQPRMAVGGVNPLDLTSAIQHELRRANSHPGWAPWNQNHQQQLQQQQQQQQFDGSRSYASSVDADSTGFSIPCGSSFHSGGDANSSQLIPQYIPRFDEGMAPALHHMPSRFELAPETESLGSACQGFYSGSRRSGANGFSPGPYHTQQVFETETQVDPTRSCSPWIERMMQADVTPTPSPINLCLSTSQGTVSCVLSQTVDLQSCHSSDRQAQSMRSAFSCEPQHESTVELSADLCTDDDDLETRPSDVKRKKRMLSNRASAQRSRQRRQERLDQLEVMTAKLRVENSTLQKKLTAAVEVAKKFDGQNKDLLKKVDRLSKELEASGKRVRKLTAPAKFNDGASSQQTAFASSCDMVGERLRGGVNPNVMRDDGGASTGTRSRSPSSSSSPKGWPIGSYRSLPQNTTNNNNNSNGESNAGSNGRTTNQGVSSVRKSFSACRMESKKRSHDQSEGGYGEVSPAAIANMEDCSTSGALESGRPLWHEVCQNNPFPGLAPSLKEDAPGDAADGLEEDRWLELTGCFLL